MTHLQSCNDYASPLLQLTAVGGQLTFTVSYDLEEEEEDTEHILQLMIILEVENGKCHLYLTALHSYVI